MPIPPNSIEIPEIVWAVPDDTLEQVRERLERAEIENKWRAYVMVRDAEGLYAVASVFEIQPLVWAAGPPALERPLRDLGLFHLLETDAGGIEGGPSVGPTGPGPGAGRFGRGNGPAVRADG